MSECERIGMNGNCGLECPVFLRKECTSADEIFKMMDELIEVEENKQIEIDLLLLI